MRRTAVLALGTITLAACTDPMGPGPVDHPASTPEVWTVLGSSAAGPVCAPVPEGLVSWWRGDGDALDFTGTNPGTPQGIVGFAAGMVGQAFSLDGRGRVVVPDHATLDLSEELAVELWFNYPSPTTFRGLLAKRIAVTNGVANYGVSLETVSLGLGLYYNDPNARGGDDFTGRGSQYESVRMLPAPSARTFHHFAGTYRQTASGIELRMYVDGQLVRSATVPGNLVNTLNDAALTIGASTQTGLEPFAGLIDEVAIYQRALTAEEVQGIYQAGAAGKCVSVNVPFAGMEVDRARVELDRGATLDRFDLWGRFELGESSDGIAPPTEEVQIRFGSMSQTIPAGSFVRTEEDDGFQFHSTLPGLKQVVLRDDGGFRVWATELDLAGVDAASPLTFEMRIGNDEGSADIAFAERLRLR